MSIALARAVTGPVRPRPRFLSFKFALGWFFLVKGVIEIIPVLTLLTLGWEGVSYTTLLLGLGYALASTLLSAYALWRLERRRQAGHSKLIF